MKLLKIILFVFLSTIVYSQELDYRFMTNKIVFKKGKNTVSSSMNNIKEFNYGVLNLKGGINIYKSKLKMENINIFNHKIGSIGF